MDAIPKKNTWMQLTYFQITYFNL